MINSYLFIFSYSLIQMDLIMEMVVEIFRRQMFPMVITICIHQHLLMKHHHPHLFLIIYKLFLDLWVILQQLQIIRTVWMPIIKRNNKKIWSTGKWKREGVKKVFFFSSYSILLLLKTNSNEKEERILFFSFVSW